MSKIHHPSLLHYTSYMSCIQMSEPGDLCINVNLATLVGVIFASWSDRSEKISCLLLYVQKNVTFFLE
jgi:hypothetical protein